jgi:hypothetical protein
MAGCGGGYEPNYHRSTEAGSVVAEEEKREGLRVAGQSHEPPERVLVLTQIFIIFCLFLELILTL